MNFRIIVMLLIPLTCVFELRILHAANMILSLYLSASLECSGKLHHFIDPHVGTTRWRIIEAHAGSTYFIFRVAVTMLFNFGLLTVLRYPVGFLLENSGWP